MPPVIAGRHPSVACLDMPGWSSNLKTVLEQSTTVLLHGRRWHDQTRSPEPVRSDIDLNLRTRTGNNRENS